MQGKGIYAWLLDRCEGGDMGAVVRRMQDSDITHIIPKIADGVYEYERNVSYLKNLVSMSHAVGIQVVPFVFVYGRYPIQEAETAIKAFKKYPYDGLVINAESAYKALPNPAQAARQYGDALRSKLPDTLLALSSYRYPTVHAPFPFKTFLDYVDINMPQVYWMDANGTVPYQLSRTLEEYKAFPPRPIVPTGAAFSEHGWTAIPDDQRIFVKEVQKHKLRACNFWEYWHAFQYKPELGQAIAEVAFDVGALPVYPPDVALPPAGTFWAKCTASQALTIRSTPVYIESGTNISGYLLSGERRLVYETSGIWWRIGDDEWVSSNYMEKISDVVSVPEEQPETPAPALTLEGRVERLEERVTKIEQAQMR